jgi:hypothetical protein
VETESLSAVGESEVDAAARDPSQMAVAGELSGALPQLAPMQGRPAQLNPRGNADLSPNVARVAGVLRSWASSTILFVRHLQLWNKLLEGGDS